MIENLKILHKIYSFEKMIYGYLKKYPQSEKFALVSETKNSIYSLSKKLIKAGIMEKKKAVLYEADAELYHLKHLIRLANDLHYISKKGYQLSSYELTEIGGMLGTWIKNEKQGNN